MGVSTIGLSSRVTRAQVRSTTRSADVEQVGLGRGQLAVGPPQQGPHPGDELAEPVGLGEVVVGPHLEAEHLVELVALHGEDEDRLAEAQAPHLAAEIEAGAVGQAHVEHDQAGVPVARVGDPARTGSLPMHRVAFLAEAVGEAFGDSRVVLDDEDRGVVLGVVRHHFERTTRAQWGSRRSPTGPAQPSAERASYQ